jgi:alanyl-tRNA synthetase
LSPSHILRIEYIEVRSYEKATGREVSVTMPNVTEKLFYKDSYKQEFDAVVTGVEPVDGGGFRILLDRTCFYPEGGGQPSDKGTINDIPVLDVRKEGDEVVHLIGDTPAFTVGGMVHGVIDWDHRYDFMQQHSGQHLISGAFFTADGINTVSVHLGEEISTVELDIETAAEDTLEHVERSVNRSICRNSPIQTEWISDEELDADTLRRAPKVSGMIRIVSAEGTDRVACGGVHVGRTGEIGLVKLVGTEVIRGNLRSIWKIGERAYDDYRLKSLITTHLVDRFSAPLGDLEAAVAGMLEKQSTIEKALREAEGRRAEDFARAMAADGENVITRVFENEESKFLKTVATALVSAEASPFCLVSKMEGRLFWSAGAPGGLSDLKPALDELLPLIDGKGGGKIPLWQGVGGRVDGAEEFLAAFRAKLSG